MQNSAQHARHRAGPRTLVLGDSWLRGLSKGQHTMSRYLPEAAGASEVLDLSRISRIVSDVVDGHLDEIEGFAPELAFLAVGGAESLVFPKPFFQKIIDRYFPPQWHGVEGLQPSARPRRDRKLRPRLEAFAKVALKQVLVNVFGPHRRQELSHYEASLRIVLDVLHAHGTVVVIIGATDVDGWGSPRSSEHIRAANRVNARVADEYRDVLFVETNPYVVKWDDYLVDHVHLARSGHRAVTDGVLGRMRSAGDPWSSLVVGVVAVAS